MVKSPLIGRASDGMENAEISDLETFVIRALVAFHEVLALVLLG